LPLTVRPANVGESPVPKPKEVRAVLPDSATKLLPLPTIKLPSVGVRPAISSNCGSCACAPKLASAVAPDSATQFVPFPTIKLLSVGVSPAMSARPALYACTSVPIATPKLVLAVDVFGRSDKLLLWFKYRPSGVVQLA
jgi:hypothetical protein